MTSAEPLPSERVLVIEDDPAHRAWIAAVLRRAGFAVETLRDGLDAIHDSELDSFSAIVLDLHMPIFDGVRLADHWATLNEGRLRRVVIVTGFPRLLEGREKPKVFSILYKPFSEEELLRNVRECVAANA